MLRAVAQSLKTSWRALVVADLLFKSIAFVVLIPLVSLLLSGFLLTSGRTMLADIDIVYFLLHPIGWLALIVVGGGLLGIWALEQAMLMTITFAEAYKQSLHVRAALRIVAPKAPGLFAIATRAIAQLLVMAAPLLAIGGGIYVWLLTDHDINYYLSAKPPKFWLAAVLIGTVVATMTGLLLRAVVNWSVAFQLHLFEHVPPRECLRASRERVFGRRTVIAGWLAAWFVINALVAFLASGIVLLVGRWTIPLTVHSLSMFYLTLGFVLCLWGAVNLAGNLVAVLSLAALQTQIYTRWGEPHPFVLPPGIQAGPAWTLSLTRGRMIAGVLIAILVSAVIGAGAIHGIRLDDRVEITAHRGASGQAPENTLASVRQAIEDGADWVEIDVQESKDGVVIVAHDSDLKKVSGADVKIWNATAQELRAIDIGSYFGPQFKGERVPTLAEVLETCRGRTKVNIEFKYYGHDQDLEQKVAELVEQYEMTGDVVLMSLDARGVKKMKALRPAWTVGLLTAVSVGDLTRAEADFLAVSSKLANHAFIDAAHRKQKPVHTWTVNDPLMMAMLISRGVDNIITDHPARAREVLRQRAEMSPIERISVELAFLFGVTPPASGDQ